MANMSARRKVRKLSEVEIDDLVEAQANDDAAWEEPIEVQPGRRDGPVDSGKVPGQFSGVRSRWAPKA